MFVPARKAPIGVARDRACSDPQRGPPPLIAPGSIPTPTAVTLPPPLHPIPPNQLQPGSVETDLLPLHTAGKNLSSSSHLRLHPHTPPSHPLVPPHPHTPPSHHHPLTPPGAHHHHHPHTPPNSHALAPPPHHPHTPPSHPVVPHHPHTPPAPHSLTSHTPPSHTPVHPSTTSPASMYHHTSSQQHASQGTSVQRTNSGNSTPGRSSACTKDQPGVVTTHTTTPASSGFVRPFEDSFPQQHGSNRRSPIVPPPPSSHSNSSSGDNSPISKIHHSQQSPYHPSGPQAGTTPCNTQQATAVGNQDACVISGGRNAVSHQHRGPPSANTHSVKENCGSVTCVNKPIMAVNPSENGSGSSAVVRRLSSASPCRGSNQVDGSCHSQTMASSPSTTSTVDNVVASQQPTLLTFQQPLTSQMLTQPSPSSSQMSPNSISHQLSPYPQVTQPNISQHQLLSQQQSSVQNLFVHTSVSSHQNHLQTQSATLHSPSSQSQQQIPVSHQHLVSSLPSSSASSIQPLHQSQQLIQTTAQLPSTCVSSQQGSMPQTSLHMLNSSSSQHQGSVSVNSPLHQIPHPSSNQHHGSLLLATTFMQGVSNSAVQHQATQNSSSHHQGSLSSASQLQGSSQTVMNSAPVCSAVSSGSNAVTFVASNQSSTVLVPACGSGPAVSGLGTVPAAVLNVPDAAKVLAAVSTNKEGATNMSVWDYHYLSRSITNHRVSTEVILFKLVLIQKQQYDLMILLYSVLCTNFIIFLQDN